MSSKSFQATKVFGDPHQVLAQGYYRRKKYLHTMGKRGEAGADFAEACKLDPSLPTSLELKRIVR